MKRVLMLVMALMAAAEASPASATIPQHANDLLQICPRDAGDMPKGIQALDRAYECMDYVQGIVDGIGLMTDLTGKRLFCFPSQEVTLGQNVAIATKFGREHPELLHYDSSVFLVLAWRKAFPCPRAKTGK